MNPPTQPHDNHVTTAIEIAIRLGLIFLIAAWCLKILSPFLSLIIWGAIIAVAIYPPFVKLTGQLGGRKKLAVTLTAVLGVGLVLVPVILLSTSMVEGATKLGHEITTGQISVPPPSESVRDWPVIGEQVYNFWHQASFNLRALLEKYPHQLSSLGKSLLGAATGTGVAILQFVISMLIAAVFLANADGARQAMQSIATRLAGSEGESNLTLATLTVRSVAVGVIGIAVIQALLGGLGMMFANVPAAGLLAIIILVLAIAQLPPLLVLLPVMFYVFSAESTTVAMIFMVWSILVSFSDAVLKPIFLGRGVDAPMLVILLGAIGGMITTGIVGLFIGAVILALGYSLFRAWVNVEDPDTGESPASPGQES